MNDIQLRNSDGRASACESQADGNGSAHRQRNEQNPRPSAENKFRTPIYGRNFQGTTTCVGALYPEGNVQVYWTWKWFDFQKDEVFRQGSRHCGFQFQNIGHLIGMWDTREIITGLPYDFSHLITTHFAAFYKKHMTTFVLSEKEREALGITDEAYFRANNEPQGIIKK